MTFLEKYFTNVGGVEIIEFLVLTEVREFGRSAVEFSLARFPY